MPIDYVEKLNDTFVELLQDLVTVFPEDGDLRVYLVTCKTAFALDDMFLYHIFKRKVSMYADQILNKDEKFIMELDIESQLETSTEKVKNYLVCVIQKLRGTWTTLTPENKEIVWKYWRTMLLLYRKIHETEQPE